MPVGASALLGGLSYMGIGRETTFGTYTTATAGLDFLSTSMKTTYESKVLEQVERSRTYSDRVKLSKIVEGEVEFYFKPLELSNGYLLQNALGGAVTTATATGETIGGLAFTHTFAVGNMDGSYGSVCMNLRKGPSSGGKVFEYSGLRVNEIMFTAEVDECLKCNIGFIGKDSTSTTNNLETAMTASTANPLTFVSGRLSVEATFASLTSSSIWHVQSVEFGWSNNLKADAESRRLGSDTLDVLPPGMTTFTLNATVRFDTTTAFDAMVAETKLSCQLQFQGPTITTSIIRQGILFNFPEVYIKDAGDPEISGPDGILTSAVVFDVVRDDTSATGYAIQALLTNAQASYT